jgi:hypothetical protein
MTLKLDLDRVPVVQHANIENRLNWGRACADIISYQDKLDEYLSNIMIPPELVGCQNLSCTNHNASIEYF